MAILSAATPAAAKFKVAPSDPGLIYLQARAASLTGDHARSADLLAALAQAQPSQVDLTRKAVTEAITAGHMDLALQQARQIPAQLLSSDARLLLATDELRRNRLERALPWLTTAGDSMPLEFLTPLVAAWSAANRGDMDKALQTIDQVPVSSLLGPMRAEQRAFILLKFKRTADAEPFARRRRRTPSALR